MNFFRELISGKDAVSSKRFTGLCLIGMFIVATIIAAFAGDLSESVESLIKTSLYAGSTLLGVGVVPDIIKTIKRPVSVIEKKEDEAITDK